MNIKTLLPAAAGVSAIVFAVVCLTAVFPGLKKIPTDYDQTVDFQGGYRFVADQEFYQELLTNPTIAQVFSSPQSLGLLSQPSTQQLLASEEEGLDVYTYQIQEAGLTVPDEAKLEIGIPPSLKIVADVFMDTQTDPVSGITVLLDSKIFYMLDNQALGNPVVFEAEISDTEDSVSQSVEDARSSKTNCFSWAYLCLGPSWVWES